MHRLDRLNGNIPANPFDFKSLTLEASVQTDWPVYCSLSPRIAKFIGKGDDSSARKPEITLEV